MSNFDKHFSLCLSFYLQNRTFIFQSNGISYSIHFILTSKKTVFRMQLINAGETLIYPFKRKHVMKKPWLAVLQKIPKNV